LTRDAALAVALLVFHGPSLEEPVEIDDEGKR
jgi:hypothetical protein